MSVSLNKNQILNSFITTVLQHPFLFIVIMAMPFSNSGLFSHNLLGITGMKAFNLFVVGLIVTWFLKGGSLRRFSCKIDKKAAVFFYLYILVFVFEFGRSFLNFHTLAMRFPGDFPTSSFSYLLSYCVKGLLYTFSFLYILQLIKTPREVLGLLIMLICSFLFFGLFSISLSYNVQTTGLLRNNLAAVFIDYFGLHYNNVATILMIGVPLFFGLALELGKRYFVLVAFMLVALFLAGSRGALGAAAIGTIFVAFYNSINSKSIGKLLVMSVMFLLALTFLSNSIINFFSGGGSEINLEEASNGRWGLMWAPLLTEFINKLSALMFGYGLFGMVQSDSYIYVINFYQASHAHNAYINLLVDAGLIMLVPFLLLFYSLFKKALTAGRLLNSPIYHGLLGSVVAYMIAAFSGRQFFPALDNMMLFPIIALIVVHIRLSNKRQTPHEHN